MLKPDRHILKNLPLSVCHCDSRPTMAGLRINERDGYNAFLFMQPSKSNLYILLFIKLYHTRTHQKKEEEYICSSGYGILKYIPLFQGHDQIILGLFFNDNYWKPI